MPIANDLRSQVPNPKSLSAWLATGLGVGLVVASPGTCGALLWGMPLAWVIGYLPGTAWQIVSIAVLIAVGIPLCASAGRALGGKKDNQAIIWDEIVTVPIVFLFVPLANWRVALSGFLLHRLMDITKPPPARQMEQLPDGLGVMADDVIAGIYACLALASLAWLDHATGWSLLLALLGR